MIRSLWTGDYVTRVGRHFELQSARIWDLPDQLPPLGVAVPGPQSCRLAGELADVMIAVEPERSLVEAFESDGGVRAGPARTSDARL